MSNAAAELLSLDGSLGGCGGLGLQLTPGNSPAAGFGQWLSSTLPSGRVRTHHGFSLHALRRPVWDEGGLVCRDHSVHPPKVGGIAADRFWEIAPEHAKRDGLTGSSPAFETMYPGYLLGTGEELRQAMGAGLWLAVDISHLYIQRSAGVLSTGTLEDMFRYDRIAEVHVSANDGTRDQHRLIAPNTFGLGWAKERLAAGTPVVFESYLHKADESTRKRQLELAFD